MFDSKSEFTRFVRHATASRVGNIAAGVDAGAFEPTLQAERHANCDTCSFKHVCDVRNHHRRETIASVDANEHYISERASDTELDLDAYPRGGDD
jgi:ATP-dependent helicase/nuclease subunit B